MNVVLRGTALNTFIRKEERLISNEPSVQLNLEKGKQNKPKERKLYIYMSKSK